MLPFMFVSTVHQCHCDAEVIGTLQLNLSYTHPKWKPFLSKSDWVHCAPVFNQRHKGSPSHNRAMPLVKWSMTFVEAFPPAIGIARIWLHIHTHILACIHSHITTHILAHNHIHTRTFICTHTQSLWDLELLEFFIKQVGTKQNLFRAPTPRFIQLCFHICIFLSDHHFLLGI